MADSIYEYIFQEEEELQREIKKIIDTPKIIPFINKKICNYTPIYASKKETALQVYNSIFDIYNKLKKTTHNPKEKAIIQSILQLKEDFLYSFNIPGSFFHLTKKQESDLLFNTFNRLSRVEQLEVFIQKIKLYSSPNKRKSELEHEAVQLFLEHQQTKKETKTEKIYVDILLELKEKYGRKEDRLHEYIYT